MLTKACDPLQIIYTFMETVFPEGWDLFQQDSALISHKAQMLQESFEKHNKFEMLTEVQIPQIFIYSNIQ